MSDRKKKIDRKATLAELERLLAVAAELFPGQVPTGSGSFGIRELELKARVRGEKIELQLELKTDKPERNREDVRRERKSDVTGPHRTYRLLKNKLQDVFRVIDKDLDGGKLPAPENTREFLELCRLLTQFAGKGEPCYPDFLAACDGFENALASGDLAATRIAFDAVIAQKKSCHHQFK